MSNNVVQIILQAVDRGVKSTLAGVKGGLDQANKASQAYHQTLSTLNGTADHFRSTMAGVIATVGGLSLFRAGAAQMISFNSTVEQSQIGIAALLRTFGEADGKTMGMSESMQIATDIQKQLQIEGLKTTATYEQLLKALQEGIGPALKAGFNPEQVVKFTSLMTQSAAALGVPMDQLGQEIRSILDGTIDANSRVAKSLGLTNEKVKEMAAQGKLFDYLSGKLKAFGEAGEAMSKTFSGALSNLKDAVGFAIGTAMEKSFGSTTAFLLRLKDAIVTVDDEANTFTFNEKIEQALARVDVAITKVLDKFSKEELAGMLASFVDLMGTIAVAVIQFVAAMAQLWQTLGPFAPAIAGIIVNFVLWGGAFKALIGLPLELLRQLTALKAVVAVLQGTSLSAWALGISTKFASLLALMSPLQLAFAGLGAFLVGMKIQDWVYKQTEPAERALYQLRGEITATEAKFSQFAAFSPVSKNDLFSKSRADLEKYKQELEGAYRYQVSVVQQLTIASRDTNMFGGLTTEAQQAQVVLGEAKSKLKTLEAAMDDYGDAAKEANSQVAGSATASVAKMKEAQGAALEAMKKKYKEYATEVKRLQGEIANEERSLATQLREMSRSGMSDASAWKDRKKEAQEYEVAAKKAAAEAKAAFEAGDTISAGEKYKEAVQAARDAKSAYAELNKEVKSGDQVVVSSQQALETSMQGVKQAGTLAISILKDQQQAAKGAMDALAQKGGLENLTAGMDEAEKTWLKNWENMKDFAGKQILYVEHQIDAMVKDRHVTVYVTEQIKKATGGLIGAYRSGGLIQALRAGGTVARNILSGGFLPGFGGGDRRLLLGEDGEVMLNKDAVREGSLTAALAFNAKRWDIVIAELINRFKPNLGSLMGYRLGGAIGSLPSLPMQGLAAGGPVAAMGGGYNASYTFTDTAGQSGVVQGSEIDIRRLEAAINKHNRFRSSNR